MSSASAGQAHRHLASSLYHFTHKIFCRIIAAGLVLQTEHKCIFSQSEWHDQVNLAWKERNSPCNDEGRWMNLDGYILYRYKKIKL